MPVGKINWPLNSHLGLMQRILQAPNQKFTNRFVIVLYAELEKLSETKWKINTFKRLVVEGNRS